MAQPVWILSVDLQTKTATFQTGMSDAAKAARSSFQDIKSGAATMGRETSGSMMEARHGVMLLGEEFGVHLPRGVTMFLSSLGPVGATMEAAFPFLAIIVGATFLIEKLMKLGDEAAKSGQAWAGVTDEIQKWGENSKKQLLEVQIATDRLIGDKLAELRDTIKLIDLQTLDHLKSEFDGVGKKADEALTKMRSNSVLTFLGMGNGVEDVQRMFSAAMDKINKDIEKGDHKQLAADLKAASDELWNMAAPTYDLVQRLHEAHNEGGAAAIAADKHYQALLNVHGVLESMTREMRDQAEIEHRKDSNAQQTLAPIRNVTDPRIAQEQRKQLESYMQTNRQKAEADEKLTEERMRMEADVTRYFTTEYAKQAELQQRAGAEGARHTLEMARLREFAQEEADKHALAMHAESAQRVLDEEIKAVNDALAIEVDGYNKEIAALDKFAADYTVKLQTLQDKIAEIKQQAQNKAQQAQDQALQKQTKDIQAAYGKMAGDISHSLGQVLTRHETFSKMVIGLGAQAASGLMENAAKAILTDDMTKPHDAKKAARKAFLAGEDTLPGTPGVILGGVLAAGAFAAVMAFDKGGIVPGVENFDAVNARLTPGEAVLPKALTEQLTNAAKFGDTSRQAHTHVHVHYAPQIHAVDGPSVRRMLDEHQDEFHNHFEHHVRKLNK